MSNPDIIFLLILSHFLAFCVGGWLSCKIVKKAVDETLNNPTGRWARFFAWSIRYFGIEEAD